MNFIVNYKILLDNSFGEKNTKFLYNRMIVQHRNKNEKKNVSENV